MLEALMQGDTVACPHPAHLSPDSKVQNSPKSKWFPRRKLRGKIRLFHLQISSVESCLTGKSIASCTERTDGI